MEKKIREYKINYIKYTGHSPEGFEENKLVWAENKKGALIEFYRKFKIDNTEIINVELY